MANLGNRATAGQMANVRTTCLVELREKEPEGLELVVLRHEGGVQRVHDVDEQTVHGGPACVGANLGGLHFGGILGGMVSPGDGRARGKGEEDDIEEFRKVLLNVDEIVEREHEQDAQENINLVPDLLDLLDFGCFLAVSLKVEEKAQEVGDELASDKAGVAGGHRDKDVGDH